MRVVLKFVFAFLAVSVSSAAYLGEEQDVNPLQLGPSSHFIGGKEVNPIERMYTVGLNLYDVGIVSIRCTAVRLDKNWFLTAAECLGRNYRKLEIIVPQDVRNGSFRHFYALRTELKFKLHPGYNRTTKENNIAVFHYPTTYSQSQTFVSLPPKSDDSKTYDNEPVVLSGVSYLKRPNQDWEALMKALPTKVVNLSECKKRYPPEDINDNTICTVNTGDDGITRDDLSAPLVIETKTGPTLIGLGVPSRFQNDPFSPPMRFARISPYVDWIKQQISAGKPSSS